jgi:hypothetical protein
LESSPNSVIGHINQIKVIDNSLLILDGFNSKSLFIFTKEGSFVRKIGSIGRGPGEYLRPDDFCYDKQNKEILILDAQTQKINIYNFYGNFKKDLHVNVGLKCTKITVQNDNIYVNGNPRVVSNKYETYLLNNLNTKGEVQKRWFKFPEYGWNSQTVFNFYEFFQTETDIKYNNPFINTIYSIRQNEVYPFITLKSDNIISISELNELKENSLKQSPPLLKLSTIINSGKMWGIHDYLENNKIIYFKYFNYGGRYQLIYDLKTNKISCGFLKDDITNSTNEFYTIDNNSLVGIIASRFDKTLKDIVFELTNKNLKIPQNELKKLEKINEMSNPILIFYELKP